MTLIATTARPVPKPVTKSSHQPMTLHEFFDLPEGPPDYELEEGRLVAMPRPHERHQEILASLIAAIRPYLIGQKLGRIWPEVEVVLPDETYVYAPDLAYLSDEHLDRRSKTTGRIHGAPDLVVEILSPSTRRRDRSTKMKVYRTAGVPWYWLVEQDDLTIEELELTERGYLVAQTITAGHTFTPALFPELTIDLAALMGEIVTPEEDEEDAV